MSALTSIATSDEEEKDLTIAPVNESEEFPDGGLRAWLVVLGVFCFAMVTGGFVNSWGVFQSYYQTTVLQDTSPSSIAWIGSLSYALIFLPGLLAGRLFDLGYFRLLLLVASTLFVLAGFLLAECTRYWQLLLCQGIAIGLASGLATAPTTAVISHWFNKRRGSALALSSVGSSLGGTLFPIFARNLIPRIGFQWTMRSIAFIVLCLLISGNLLVTQRLPPTNAPGGLFNPRAFRSPAFSFYCLSTFTIYLGIYTVLTYIDVSASQNHLPEEFTFYLVAIANAASGVGRCCAGFLADRMGSMNVMIPLTTVCAVVTFVWPFAESKKEYVVVALIYGFSCGFFVSLLANPVMAMGDSVDVGRRVGTVTSILSIGSLIGPPISGAINAKTGGFVSVGYYAGSTVLVGVALMATSRYLVLKQVWGKL